MLHPNKTQTCISLSSYIPFSSQFTLQHFWKRIFFCKRCHYPRLRFLRGESFLLSSEATKSSYMHSVNTVLVKTVNDFSLQSTLLWCKNKGGHITREPEVPWGSKALTQFTKQDIQIYYRCYFKRSVLFCPPQMLPGTELGTLWCEAWPVIGC
jgi:hypothetical protein